MLSSVSKMLEKVGEGMAMAINIAAGDLSLMELEDKVWLYELVEIKKNYAKDVTIVNHSWLR